MELKRVNYLGVLYFLMSLIDNFIIFCIEQI
jgi:hypothetical protein